MNPRRLSGRMLLTWGLLAALILGGVLLGTSAGEGVPYDHTSTGPQGLLALVRWLEAMGHPVTTTLGTRFELPARASLVFVYPSRFPYAESEAAELDQWVKDGGTLVLVGPASGDGVLARTFGVRVAPSAGFGDLSLDPRRRLHQAVPMLPEGPDVLGRLDAGPSLDLSDAPAAVVVLATGSGQPTMAVQARAAGWVWHLSPRHALVNAGWAADANSPDDPTPNMDVGPDSFLVPVLLRHVPAGGLAVIDTYHLSDAPASEQPWSLTDWLDTSNTGHAIWFLAAVLFFGRLLLGIRLGPPLVVPTASRRREAAEYVLAVADLQRRARKQAAVARHHKQRLKRALGRPLQLDPDLPDAAFLARLEALDDRLDPDRRTAIHRLLTILAGDPTEEQLVRAAAEVDALIGPPAV